MYNYIVTDTAGENMFKVEIWRLIMRKFFVAAVMGLFFLKLPISAQLYPDTLWVPVTFYDFHSDGSNPEFECDHQGDLHTNMVARTLGSDSKPVKGSTPYLNHYIKYWYRDWNSSQGGKGDYTIPDYRKLSGGTYDARIRYEGDISVNYDTAFKNIVIKDSLPFLHQGDGVYQFKDDAFFPLDNRGFGREGEYHNFSFTMELHWEFVKKPGLTFHFTGDDDVWAYIDGQLRMDLGGIHSALNGSFNLDDIPGLVDGETYMLDFFYAERHTSESHIRITTNIISAEPAKIELNVEPSDTIRAGDTLRIISTVWDQDSVVRPDFSEKTTWEFVDDGGNGSSTLFPRQGDSAFFVPTVAWTNVLIRGIVSIGGTVVSDTVEIYVLPGPPHHLVIEASPPPFTGSRLNNDTPLDVLRIRSNQAEGKAYAIIRDRYENFVDASQNTIWNITKGADIIDNVTAGDNSIGEGIVTKKGPEGEGEVTAKSGDHSGSRFTDALRVVVDEVEYNGLRISLDAPDNPITSLATKTGDISLLIVEGQRKDGLGWESVPGNWSKSSALKTADSPPVSSQNWSFSPTDTGRGSIGATYSGLSASISVVVNPGGPSSIVLYPSSSGSPYQNPPSSYEDTAGIEFPLYAKVFDPNGVWLKQYDNSSAPITWRISEYLGTPPTGDLSRSSGHTNEFTPERAHNTVHIVATFSEGGRVFSDSVRVHVVSGPPDHITIQNDTASINGWVDITQISMSSTETDRNLFAIIRDRYGNFWDYAEQAEWLSRDSSIVFAESSPNPFYGEGIITRNTDISNQVRVVVNSKDGSLTDSVLVRLMDITYDSLRIYVLDNGPKYIDTIKIRTDETDTLWVEGKRSDDGGWENIPVVWTASSGLKVKGAPPSWSEFWGITPDSVDTGLIIASRSGAASDSVVAVFLPGLPGNIRLYKAEGQPSSVDAYPIPPITDTIQAGNTYPFVAKIFDRNGIWLPDYENSAVSRTLISWRISRISGAAQADTLDSRRGHLVTFSPQKAYNSYQITAEFTEDGRTFTASVNIFVNPGSPDHLVVEGIPNPTGINLSRDNPLDIIDFGSKDTVKSAYAIVRDKFGNFINQSQSTRWNSLDLSIVSANEGTSVLGEGRVIRTGNLGETRVVAVNRNDPSLFDTVNVKLSDVSYDSLRIVIDDSTRIDSLVIRSDQDTILYVQGKRTHDQVWVGVDGNWNYRSSSTNANSSGSMWEFAPGDTGTGIIVVTRSGSVPDTIHVRVVPGLPRKLALYAKEGLVPNVSNPPYPNPTSSITATAGKPFPLVAKVFDHKNVWLPEYELQSVTSNQIHWSIEEFPGSDSSGFLDDTIGHKRSFMPVRAYQSVYLIANLKHNNTYLTDTVKLYIEPGAPKQLVIEGSYDWESSKNKINPIAVLQITDSVTNASAYAILRDSIGNYINYSTKTTWGVVDDDTSVTVRSGNTNIGEGIIQRVIREGNVKVFAIDNNTGLRDTVDVQLLPYYYTKLRIIMKTDSIFEPVTMTTNDDTTFHVQGLRSDSLMWVDVSARWENSSNLSIIPTAPGWSNSWSLSPSDTGEGWIRVTRDNDFLTQPDTVRVRFEKGPPTRTAIEIITPPEQRVAGKPIEVEVRIYNENGLVPGKYCFYDTTGGVKYTDTLGSGGRPKPFVLVGEDTLWLSESGEQCFYGGKDTVLLTLFYAPYDAADSMHQIRVDLGDLTAVTRPFDILPGEIDSLTLEYQNGTPVGDTIVLRYPLGQTRVYSVGYDRYGNKRGPEKSNWSSDSTLHPVSNSQNAENIFYDASSVTDNEYGNIVAVPSQQSPDELQASTFVKIIGPLTTVTTAVTQDKNGNGYLDHIELHFSKPVTLPDSLLKSMEITYGSISFSIDSIAGNPNRTDSIWVIAIEEEQNGKPQTSWTPRISFDYSLEAGIDSMQNHLTVDGAGPVVWEVTKEIKVAGDRKKDVVTVIFSEPVRNTQNGSALNESDIPDLMFYVWLKDPKDASKYIKIDSILIGIEHLQSAGDSIAIFTTYNNNDITSRHFFSIKTTNDSLSSYLSDRADLINFPETVNQKVRVIVTGPAPREVIPVPNPTFPTVRRVPAGQFKAIHEPNARDWVKRDNAGTVITFPILIPEQGPQRDVKLRCVVKVYDMVGNMVNMDETDDLIPSLLADYNRRDSSIFPIDIYWNGFNKNKMRAAPGVYKIVVNLEFHGSNAAKELNRHLVVPMIANVGIRMGKVR